MWQWEREAVGTHKHPHLDAMERASSTVLTRSLLRTCVQGYLSNPAATASTIVQGWLHTGDIACRDERGNYYIVGV